MKIIRATMTYILYFLIAAFIISCESPTGNFVYNKYEDWSDVIVIPIQFDSNLNKFLSFKEIINQNPGTVSLSGLSDIPGKSESKVIVNIQNEEEKGGVEAYLSFIDYDFCETLGLEFYMGRNFSREIPADSAVYLINESFSQLLEAKSASESSFLPIGQEINFKFNSKNYQGFIVGVIEDYCIYVERGEIDESIPMIFKYSPAEFRYLAVKSNYIASTKQLFETNWNKLGLTTPVNSFILGDEVSDIIKIMQRNRIHTTVSAMAFIILLFALGFIANRRGIMGSLFRMKGRINRAKFNIIGSISNIAVWFPIVLFFLIYTNVPLTGSIEFLFTNLIYVLFILCYLLLFLVIDISLIVKRLHDLDLQGSKIWLGLVPFYNIYIAFLLQFEKGTEGPNKFGEDPIKKD